MKRLIKYCYTRDLYTEASFILAYKMLPGLVLAILLLVFSSFMQGLDVASRLSYGIILVLTLLLTGLNWLGSKKIHQRSLFNWRWIPYVSSLYATVIAWWLVVEHAEVIFTITPSSKYFLIYYPMIFPIVIWTTQYVLIDHYKVCEPRKDLFRKIPAYAILLPLIIFGTLYIISNVFNLSGFDFGGYAFGSGLALFTWIIPFGFTGVSTYWHPELEQSRYGNALADLKNAKKKLPKQKNQLQKTLKK